MIEVAGRSGLVNEEVFRATPAASSISISLNVFIVRGIFKWVGPKLAVEEVAV